MGWEGGRIERMIILLILGCFVLPAPLPMDGLGRWKDGENDRNDVQSCPLKFTLLHAKGMNMSI